MTKEELDFIGSMNMCDEISNEAYKKIVSHVEETEISDDCVSRQAVIEQAKDYGSGTFLIPVNSVKVLSPVTPTHGTCEDCKHRDPEDKMCDCGHTIQWQLPREDNWYCKDFEKRGNSDDSN